MTERSAVNICYKYTIFFVCFSAWLVTGFAVGIAAYALHEDETKPKKFMECVGDAPCLMCIFASYLTLMFFLGWLGALREYTLSLLLFKILLIGIILIELAVIILVFLLVYNDDTRDFLYDKDFYQSAITNYRDPQFESLQEAIDTIQQDWKCCGISNDNEGYKDWMANEYFNCTPELPVTGEFCSVPYTCCKTVEGQIINVACGRLMNHPDTTAAKREETIYTKGCFLALTDLLTDNVLWIGVVAICVIIPEIVLIRLSESLSDQIKIQRSKWVAAPKNFDRIATIT